MLFFHKNTTVNRNGYQQEPLGGSGMDLTRPRSWGRVLQIMIRGSSFLSLPDLSLFPQTRHSRHARADSTGGNYFQASAMFGDKHNKSSLGRSYFLPSNVVAAAAADSRCWSDTKNGGFFFLYYISVQHAWENKVQTIINMHPKADPSLLFVSTDGWGFLHADTRMQTHAWTECRLQEWE